MIKIICPLITRKYAATTIFPFIFFKNKEKLNDRFIVNHEMIHVRQQLELLVIPMWILYGLNYLLNRLKGMGHDIAYLDIIFEREAYGHDHDMKYLTKRKWYAWIKH